MPKLSKVKQRVFGATGSETEFGKIGSKSAGAPLTTKDLEAIQSLDEYSLGYFGITLDRGVSRLPYAEDLNSLFYLLTSQIAYLHQAGIPEWDAETEYYKDKSVVLHEGQLYTCLSGTEASPNRGLNPLETKGIRWKLTFTPTTIDPDSNPDHTPPTGEAFTLPIGFTYIQFPDSTHPEDLGLGSWELLNENLNGRFLRVDGAEATDFEAGGLQDSQANPLTVKVVGADEACDESGTTVTIPSTDSSRCLNAGLLAPNVRDSFHTGKLKFSRAGDEVRPKNLTIRIWKKISN